MESFYSTNVNVQLLVALLKEHGIKKIIASPGTTNLELMASLQNDGYFEIYSCVDERSAAYIACGLATESQEPVVITCTEATASRNYYSGLTEAYHRKLPILAVTGLHNYNLIGHLEPQVIDRSVSPKDTLRLKVNLPVIKDQADVEYSMLKINDAILELKRHGGGPVHINIPWGGGNFDFSVKTLPNTRVIKRIDRNDVLPELKNKRVAIYIGTHLEFSESDTKYIDQFCADYNSVVFCDHTSQYYGKYRIQLDLLVIQKSKLRELENIDVLIHIGEESGDNAVQNALKSVKEVWRVSPDGEIRDTFKKLKYVFEMPEITFFNLYQKRESCTPSDSFYKIFREKYDSIFHKIPELEFSSIYVASEISAKLPPKSIIHFGVSDTIRAWSMFELPVGVKSRCNSGCRGIDGCVSALVGASLYDEKRLYYGVVGDLTFFYDMNVLGNRHIGRNIRLIIINNNGGNIFRHNGHPTQRWLGYGKTNMYIAAGGHFGQQSKDFLKHYCEDLGFEYLTASNKNEFQIAMQRFLIPEVTDKSMVLEIFTKSENDNNAFDSMSCIEMDVKGKTKQVIKGVLGKNGTEIAKKLFNN